MRLIDEEIKSIIIDKLDVKENVVVNDAKFTNNLGADSLDLIELIMAFEDTFMITIPDDNIDKY